jgi:hypothetical protein
MYHILLKCDGSWKHATFSCAWVLFRCGYGEICCYMSALRFKPKLNDVMLLHCCQMTLLSIVCTIWFSLPLRNRVIFYSTCLCYPVHNPVDYFPEWCNYGLCEYTMRIKESCQMYQGFRRGHNHSHCRYSFCVMKLRLVSGASLLQI